MDMPLKRTRDKSDRDATRASIDRNGAADFEALYREYQERETKLLQVLDSLPYRIMVVNMDMTIDKVNESFLREFDCKRDEIFGMRC